MSGPVACPHQGVCSTLPAHLHFHAVASFSGLAALRALTINHHNAGLAGLQHLSMACDAVSRLHAELTRRGIESVVLKTCNRSEVYWRARVPGDDELVTVSFADCLGVGVSELADAATSLAGEAAAAHLFRVCCGLESLIVGEAEILGQVRDALTASPAAGAFLEGIVRAALRTGRAARAETGIGTGALSVASAGVQWLAERLSSPQAKVVVIGAGDTGAKVARRAATLGADRLVILNRTISRAQALAASIGARAGGLDALPRELAAADAIICTATAPEWLVTLDALRTAASSDRPLFVVDLAMPAGVEPGDVAGVTRIDLSGLEELAERHRWQRAAEIPAVEAVIARELQWLQAWARHQAMRPLVSELRRKVEAIRRAELAKAERELAGGAPDDPAVLDRLSRRLLDRLLEIPLAQLEAGDLPLDAAHAEYLRRLFALPSEARESPAGARA
jgi:glutamyl-tRNA reductase